MNKMNKLNIILVVLVMTLTILQCKKIQSHHGDRTNIDSLITENLQFAQDKITYFIENLDVNTYPGSIDDEGQLKTITAKSWESGYMAGILWYLYDYTNNPKWKVFAQQWTAGLELQKFNKNSHDLLFMLYASFGNGYKITQDELYKDVLIVGSNSLASRYDPEIKCIKSWDPLYQGMAIQFPVIIDALMANEMLFYAASISGDSNLYNIAYNHALNTKRDFFREDYSTYYLVEYDTILNTVKEKRTWMGYSDESTWARGHARAIYGSAVTFRETGDSSFLELAKKAAEFYMNHPRLPADLIPYWDFDDPDIPNAPRDASAACIAASGLLELSSLLPSDEQAKYADFAIRTLKSLASDTYRNKPSENLGFILKNSTGSRTWNIDVDKPKISADYYFVESLVKLNKLKNSLNY
jgi:hypothetical protein